MRRFTRYFSRSSELSVRRSEISPVSINAFNVSLAPVHCRSPKLLTLILKTEATFEHDANLQSASGPHLPFELILIIVELAPPGCFPAILYASKAFKEAGEPLLYRHIDLTYSPARTLLLWRTLVSSPRLARMIRTYQGSPYMPDRGTYVPVSHFRLTLRGLRRNITLEEDPKTAENRKTVYRKLSAAIVRLLTNAESIALLQVPQRLQASCPTTQRLRIQGSFFDIEGPAGFAMLRRVDLAHITYLDLPAELGGGHELDNVNPFTPDWLPKLEELVCSDIMACILVPGRPIRSLVVKFADGLRRLASMALFDEIAKGTGFILHFGVQGFREPQLDFSWLLEELVCECPTLRKVERLSLMHVYIGEGLGHIIEVRKYLRGVSAF